LAKLGIRKCANLNCNEDFTQKAPNQRFCSHKCQNEDYNNRFRKEVHEKRHCSVCNKLFIPKQYNSKYCSTRCERFASRKRQDGNPIIQHKPWWGKNKMEKITELGGKCVKCGYSADIRALVIHHIVPKAMGGSDESSNLVVLCANCHAIVHYKTVVQEGGIIFVKKRIIPKLKLQEVI